VIGSTQPGEAKGMVQGTIPVDVTLDQIQSEQVDALVIVGGSGAKMYLWFNPELKRLVRGLNKKHRPIGAVSIAPAALVYAGILNGRKASVLPAPETKKLFERNGVEMAGADTTVDENIVTTATSSGAAAVALAVAQQLPHKSHATPLETIAPMQSVKPKPTVALPGRKPRKTE
jgi:protease I